MGMKVYGGDQIHLNGNILVNGTNIMVYMKEVYFMGQGSRILQI